MFDAYLERITNEAYYNNEPDGIEINRKVLADLAMNHPEAFKAVVAKAKAA